ncbi:diguanylate cyclase [Exiguobacterium sp. s160]|uniref:GGDEF domain-containing protein n=1 Tax=Exiguobacterium sp. s160 TaxID=2751265 RepID=UPI001BEB4620|nr:diguanylate cyclase [Exiguobacterium sp. s160]
MGMVINQFFINISIIFLLMSLTLYVMRTVLPIQPSSPLFVRFWFGVSNGLTAILLTLNAIELGDARIDLRLIPIALSATYAGPFGAVVTLALIFIGRMTLHGMSAPFVDSILMFVVLYIFSLLLSRVPMHRSRGYTVYVGFGALLVLIRVTGSVDAMVFVNVFIPYFLMLSLGAWLCYWGAKKLETHLWMFLLHTHRATVDELTGLPNRYRTLEQMNELEMSGKPWTLLVIDVDHFKQLNDTYGHLAGDAALRHIGQTLERHCPSGGFVGRYGGEEFLLVIEGNERAKEMAESLVETVRHTTFECQGEVIPMTVSIGAAVAEHEPSMVVFERADEALYDAKRNGRDQVRFA